MGMGPYGQPGYGGQMPNGQMGQMGYPGGGYGQQNPQMPGYGQQNPQMPGYAQQNQMPAQQNQMPDYKPQNPPLQGYEQQNPQGYGAGPMSAYPQQAFGMPGQQPVYCAPTTEAARDYNKAVEEAFEKYKKDINTSKGQQAAPPQYGTQMPQYGTQMPQDAFGQPSIQAQAYQNQAYGGQQTQQQVFSNNAPYANMNGYAYGATRGVKATHTVTRRAGACC